MGTTSSALTSTAGFTGASQFSTDFQNVITRAVQIASLPITQLQGDVTTYQAQADALNKSDGTGIDPQIAALQTAVQGIASAMSGSGFTAEVSDTGVLTATSADGAVEGNYSIDVQDVGSYASSISASPWVAATGAAHKYQLWIGDRSNPRNEIDINPSDNSAASVVSAINLAAGSKVHASVVNGSGGDTYISLQGTSLGPNTLDLLDPATSASGLQKPQTPGTLAKYVVDGVTQADGSAQTSTSRSITISPGVTVNLLSANATGKPVNLTVSRSSTALSTALQTFATQYNIVVDALDGQRGLGSGSTAGALSGQSVISTITRAISSIGTYSAAGSQINGLKALGLELGVDGHLTFTSMNLMATDITNSAGVASFLGSPTGGGFLQAATDALNGLEDPNTGIIKNAESTIAAQIAATNLQISDKQAQVNQMQTDLQARMSQADAAIAAMEQQLSYITNMFQAEQTASQQYK